MDELQIARWLAAARVAIGGALLVAPGLAGSRWIGEAAHQRSAKVVIRGLGARDVVLGLGTFRAIDRGAPVAPWLQAGMLSDGVDFVATTLAIRDLPWRASVPTLGIAGSAVALAARALRGFDRTSRAPGGI
jgi:hypothetical protein